MLNGAKYISYNAFRDKKSFVALLFHTVYSMSLVQFTVSRLSSNVIGRWIPHFSIMCDLPLLPFFFRFRLKSKCYIEDLSSFNACKDLK